MNQRISSSLATLLVIVVAAPVLARGADRAAFHPLPTAGSLAVLTFSQLSALNAPQLGPVPAFDLLDQNRTPAKSGIRIPAAVAFERITQAVGKGAVSSADALLKEAYDFDRPEAGGPPAADAVTPSAFRPFHTSRSAQARWYERPRSHPPSNAPRIPRSLPLASAAAINAWKEQVQSSLASDGVDAEVGLYKDGPRDIVSGPNIISVRLSRHDVTAEKMIFGLLELQAQQPKWPADKITEVIIKGHAYRDRIPFARARTLSPAEAGLVLGRLGNAEIAAYSRPLILAPGWRLVERIPADAALLKPNLQESGWVLHQRFDRPEGDASSYYLLY